MKKTLKFYLLTLLFFTNAYIFGQGFPPDGDEGQDPVPSPIDGKIIMLALIAIVFAFFILNKKTSKSH